MLVYNYDPETGAFLYESEADPSPREPGVFLIPAHATTLEPKPQLDGYVVVFRKGRWGYVLASAPHEDAQDEPPPPSMFDYSNAIQVALDSKAQERHYDSMASAISYRGDTNPIFAAEAEALFAWRSAVWTKATAELEKFQSGERVQPTVDEFLTELPPFSWP